jgi:hypothetical protein
MRRALFFLQGLTGTVVMVERSLKNSKEVTLGDYATREDAMTKKNKGNARTLRKVR